MAIEKIIDLQIQSNADQAEKSIGTLKQQLKAAKAEVLALSDEFGITSQQAIHAAEKAAELGHEISAANKLVKTFNPSSTLNSTTQALGSVKEGFEMAGSTMKNFGVESSQLEGALGKVGMAMELTSGITAIQESAGAFSRLGATLKSYAIIQKIVSAGQWLWNAAVSANPIGALVIVIAALIAAGVALTKYFMDNAKAAAADAKAVEENKKALESQTKTLEKNQIAFDKKQKQELAMAKASGQSADAIRKLELKLIDEQIAYEKSARAIAWNTLEKNKNKLASLKAADADEDIIKSQQEVTNSSILEYNKQNQNVQKAFDERKDTINRHEVEVRQALTNHNKEISDKNKEHLKELAEARKKAQEDRIKQEQDWAKETRDRQIANGYKAQDDIDEATKANANKLLTKQQLEIQAEEADYKLKYDNAVKAGYDKNTGLQELEKDHLSKIKTINDNARLEDDAKKATELEKKIADKDTDYEDKLIAIDAEQALYQKQFDDKLITEADFTTKTNALSTSRKELQKIEHEEHLKQMGQLANALDGLAKLAGEKTAAGKALAIAAATINTYKGISEVWGAKSIGNPIVDMAVKIASTAIVAAQGIANVSKIMSVKVPGGGGGGGSVPTASTATAPQFNVVGASGANQIAQSIGGQEQQPIKAYVTAGDVTTGQSLNRNIISNASMG